MYILAGENEDKFLGKCLYIGEGDPLLPRLNEHYLKREWWSELIFFYVSNHTLNKAFIQYLEAELIQLAIKSGRFFLENNNKPLKPSLSEKDEAICKAFLSEMILCLPILGLNFSSFQYSEKTSDSWLSINSKGIKAMGIEVAEGFRVKAGSEAFNQETKKLYLKVLVNCASNLK